MHVYFAYFIPRTGLTKNYARFLISDSYASWYVYLCLLISEKTMLGQIKSAYECVWVSVEVSVCVCVSVKSIFFIFIYENQYFSSGTKFGL